MSKPASSAALPIAHVVLRILIVLNWFSAVAIATLLFAMPTRRWLMSALELTPSHETDQVILGARAIAAIGLVMVPLNHIILKRLLAIVDTVRSGDPFVTANAARLRAIAWTLLTLQLLGIVIGLIAKGISRSAPLFHVDAGFSINGWLAVLLTFLLARVFAEGAMMRDDLDGTI
jgi:hypothetical protein